MASTGARPADPKGLRRSHKVKMSLEASWGRGACVDGARAGSPCAVEGEVPGDLMWRPSLFCASRTGGPGTLAERLLAGKGTRQAPENHPHLQGGELKQRQPGAFLSQGSGLCKALRVDLFFFLKK